MKITDFALIFLGVVLPIIIIVYVNVSFNIKAIEEEMYYQKLVDSALADANTKMKEVESDDPENDYGYSGLIDNRVSINANIAADTFFSSFANNLNIKGNKDAEMYLKYFVPALAIIDYNGIYIYSIEEFMKNGNKTIDHVMHPKRYFSYTYGIYNGKLITEPEEIALNTNLNGFSTHTIEFSMDDYVVHRGRVKIGSVYEDFDSKGFYLTDEKNNFALVGSTWGSKDVKDKVVKHLADVRKSIIIEVITKELTAAVNKHNTYARAAGINYMFSFPYITEDEMYRYVEDIGVLAVVQGISVGNKYLNYKSYGSAAIELAPRFYVSTPSNYSKFKRNLYHKENSCPEYRVSNNTNIAPKYLNTKQQAAALKASIIDTVTNKTTIVEGFYPCPVCRP